MLYGSSFVTVLLRLELLAFFSRPTLTAASGVSAVSPQSGLCDPRAGDQVATNFIVGVPTRAWTIHTIVCTVRFKTC